MTPARLVAFAFIVGLCLAAGARAGTRPATGALATEGACPDDTLWAEMTYLESFRHHIREGLMAAAYFTQRAELAAREMARAKTQARAYRELLDFYMTQLRAATPEGLPFARYRCTHERHRTASVLEPAVAHVTGGDVARLEATVNRALEPQILARLGLAAPAWFTLPRFTAADPDDIAAHRAQLAIRLEKRQLPDMMALNDPNTGTPVPEEEQVYFDRFLPVLIAGLDALKAGKERYLGPPVRKQSTARFDPSLLFGLVNTDHDLDGTPAVLVDEDPHGRRYRATLGTYTYAKGDCLRATVEPGVQLTYVPHACNDAYFSDRGLLVLESRSGAQAFGPVLARLGVTLGEVEQTAGAPQPLMDGVDEAQAAAPATRLLCNHVVPFAADEKFEPIHPATIEKLALVLQSRHLLSARARARAGLVQKGTSIASDLEKGTDDQVFLSYGEGVDYLQGPILVLRSAVLFARGAAFTSRDSMWSGVPSYPLDTFSLWPARSPDDPAERLAWARRRDADVLDMAMDPPVEYFERTTAHGRQPPVWEGRNNELLIRHRLPLDPYLIAVIVPPGYKDAPALTAWKHLMIETPPWRGGRDLAYRELVVGRADPDLAARLAQLREAGSPDYPETLMHAYRQLLEAEPQQPTRAGERQRKFRQITE